MNRIEDLFEPVDGEPARRVDCRTTPLDEAVAVLGFKRVYDALLNQAAEIATDGRKGPR